MVLHKSISANTQRSYISLLTCTSKLARIGWRQEYALRNHCLNKYFYLTSLKIPSCIEDAPPPPRLLGKTTKEFKCAAIGGIQDKNIIIIIFESVAYMNICI